MTHTTLLWSFSELLSKLKALNRHLFKLLSVSSVNHGVAQWDIYPHDQNDRLRTSKHPTFSRVTDSSMVLTDAKIATNNRLLERGALTGRLFLGLIMYMPTKKTQHWAKRYHILYSGIWNGMNGSSIKLRLVLFCQLSLILKKVSEQNTPVIALKPEICDAVFWIPTS